MGNCSMSKERNSSFELLRLLAMVTIVIGHFSGQSFIATTGNPLNHAIADFIGAGGRIAVNEFLLVGTWFMVDATFKPERLLGLYVQVALYTIPLTVIMIVLGMSGGERNIIQGFLPFFGRPLWFATACISLIALTPFLNLAFRLNDCDLGRLVGLLVFFFSVVSTIPAFTAPEYPAEVAWFFVVYICMGWAKRTKFLDRLPSKWWSLILGGGMLLALSFARMLPVTARVAEYWLIHLPALPNILIAVLIFNFFRCLEVGSIRLVNLMASSVFAVYIVHQTPAFRECLWNVLCQAGALAASSRTSFVFELIGVVCCLFVSVTIVDHGYRIRAQRLIERSALFAYAVRTLNGIYKQQDKERKKR